MTHYQEKTHSHMSRVARYLSSRKLTQGADNSTIMSNMHACADESSFEWIRSGRRKLLSKEFQSWKGNFVSHLLPNHFAAYAKILHGIAANYENIDHPLAENEVAILKIPQCAELLPYIERLRERDRSPRLRWRTLAELFDVPFQPEICHEWFRASMDEPGCWPRFLLGPDEGNLNAEELAEMTSSLSAFRGNQNCFFRFAEIPLITSDKPLLFCGRLDDLGPFLAHEKYQFTPEYWWPDDQSWCFCADYDLAFSVLGGPKELISQVLSNAILETLEVTPNTRIDSSAPIPR